MARPQWIPTPDDIAMVERMARCGIPEAMVADILDVCLRTFIDCRKRNPDLDRAWRKGQGDACVKLSEKAHAMALEGNVKLLQFLLINRLGWSMSGNKPSTMEGEVIEHDSGATRERSISEDDFKKARDEARRLRVVGSQSS